MTTFVSKEDAEKDLSEDLNGKEKAIFAILNRNIIMNLWASPVNQKIEWERVKRELLQNKELAEFIVNNLEE